MEASLYMEVYIYPASTPFYYFSSSINGIYWEGNQNYAYSVS
jgi:hypothetical protein